MIKKTRILPASEKNLLLAARAIQKGELVVFPTETVYGLGANALNANAVKNIFKAKNRPQDNPLIVHVASLETIYALAKDVPRSAKALMHHFWPGPLTIVLRGSGLIPSNVTAGQKTIALRMPDNSIAIKLIRLSGVPIAAPSANMSGRTSPTKPIHALEDLNGKVEIILDGGATKLGLESTVIDLTQTKPIILRPGIITKKEVEKVLRVKIKTSTKISGTNKSPGMKYKHYSPKAKLVLVDNSRSIAMFVEKYQKQGIKVGVMGFGKKIHRAGVVQVFLGLKNQPNKIAKNLFSAMRKLDEKRVGVILVETIAEKDVGEAVMNRLRKAADAII